MFKENLLAIGRDFKIIDLGDQGFRLAVFQIETLQRFFAIGFAHEEKLSGCAGLKPGKCCRRNRQIDDARGDTVEIDVHGRYGCRLVVLLFILLRCRVIFFVTVLVGIFFVGVLGRALFLIAFLGQGRKDIAAQYRHPYGIGHAIVGVLQREPVV